MAEVRKGAFEVKTVINEGDETTVGKDGVTSIVYFCPNGESSETAHFADIHKDGKVYRCLKLEQVIWNE